MPIFFSSAPGGHAGEFALHQKRGELLAIHFREDGVEIGRAAVGDPHFLAVEDVVLAVRAQIGASARGQRIRSRLRFAERVGGDHFRVRHLGKIALLLVLGAEQQQRQRADAALPAVPGRVGAVFRDAFGHQHGGSEIHLHAAVFFRKMHGR